LAFADTGETNTFRLIEEYQQLAGGEQLAVREAILDEDEGVNKLDLHPTEKQKL